MNTEKPKIRKRLNRFRPQGVWPAFLAALSILIIAGLGPSQAFANPTNPSTQATGQIQHHATSSTKLSNNANATTQPNSPRVSQRPLVTPAIVANGVRMYEVSPFEGGGWPTRLAGDDTYGDGELIAVEVEFSENVSVNSNATFRIQIGSSWRGLVPVSQRGNTVIFATLIRSSDRDTDGIWIGDNTSTLDHNPDEYFWDSNGNHNVSLTHSSLGTQSSHKVDGRSTRPKVNRVRITSSPQHGDAYVRGEEVKVEVRFDRSVKVTGTPVTRLSIEAFGAVATRHASYFSGSGSSTLVFVYHVRLLDNDGDGIAIPANSLAKNGDISLGPEGGGSIKSSSRTLRANLANDAQASNASHKVDARYVAASEIMANTQWGWKTRTGTSDSITMDFTIREDPGHFSEDHALVMAFGWSSIGSTRFGFGIRTDLDDPDTDGSEGKGIVFNRWDTHDKTLANPTDDGWVVTGTILGDFISIRKPYDWGVGDYTVRIAHDGSENDADGRWFGMWITDSDGVETHMGSLKFSFDDSENPKFNPRGDLYQSMLALLGGGVIKPQDIPVFEVALSPPDEGSSIDPPKRVIPIYSQFNGVMTNSNITLDREDNVVIMRAGGSTLRTTNPGSTIVIRNDPATGTPTIGGTAQVGQILGASTSGINDADGLDRTKFAYQWIRVDGTSETDISNARSRTYTLGSADVGKTIKVRVSFTDDAGFEESLTSGATDTIRWPPLTAEFRDTPTTHNGQDSFTFELRFSENISSLSYRTLRDSAFTVSGGDAINARRLARPENIRWEITVEPDGNGAVTVTLPATTDCNATGAICTGDGRMLAGPTTMTVSGPGG